MDYEKAWYLLREWLQDALDEGEERGFNKYDTNNAIENGMYEAYEMVMSVIKRLETK